MSESFEKAVEVLQVNLLGRSAMGTSNMRSALTAALPHLTAQDVPHVAREAWGVGRAMGLSDHSASMRAGRSLRSPNPYAEEADHDPA